MDGERGALVIRTVAELLDYRARANPERTAIMYGGNCYSYGQLRANARRIAAVLPVSAGERFGIVDQNTIEAVELTLAGAYNGAVPVIVNWRLIAEEAERILADADCRVVFVGSAGDVDPAVRTLLAERFCVYRTAVRFETPREPHPAVRRELHEERPLQPEPGDDFLQLYTSGTTGAPKGVRTTHANMLGLCLQLALEMPAFGAGSSNLVTAPFFHIAGIGYLLCGLYAGARNVLLPRFEARTVIDSIQNEAISHALLVPAMQKAVLDEAERVRADFSSLQHILYGAAPIPEPLLRRAAAVFACDFTQAYGLTETTGVATLLTYDDHRTMWSDGATSAARARISSAGRAAAGIEIQVVDDEGCVLGPGVEGEVVICGVTVMPSYWKGPLLGDRGGRLHTGDVGYLDEQGYLFLMDRLDDLIVTGGEKVYPVEVERAIHGAPGIRDAAVAGIPDEDYGEIVCAFIVADENVEADELHAFLKQHLVDYKRPRHFEFRDALPRSPSGKVLRRELRAPFWKGQKRRIH